MKVVLQNLTKVFPSRNKKSNEEVVAVSDFNFEIPDGKLIGLLGPSGCGKSTTLYMISGLQKPSSGKIFFGEDDVTHLSPENRGVGLLLTQVTMFLVTRYHTPIHDKFAQTVTVDMASQRIFDSTEDLLEYKKRVSAENAEKESY